MVHNDDEASDIVQEAYEKLIMLDGWAAIGNPPGYVMRMIRNLAIDRIRRARVVAMQPLPPPTSPDLADERPDSFRVVAAQIEMARVQQAISTLPERCRVVLVRRRFGEETPCGIASDLGISISTFEKRLARAVELLSHLLTSKGWRPEEQPAGKQDHQMLR